MTVMDVANKTPPQGKKTHWCVCMRGNVSDIVTLGRHKYICAFCASSMERRHWLNQTGSKTPPREPVWHFNRRAARHPRGLIPLLQRQPARSLPQTPLKSPGTLNSHLAPPPFNKIDFYKMFCSRNNEAKVFDIAAHDGTTTWVLHNFRMCVCVCQGVKSKSLAFDWTIKWAGLKCCDTIGWH